MTFMIAAFKPIAPILKDWVSRPISGGTWVFFLVLAMLATPFCAQAEPHETTLKLLKQEKFTDAQDFIENYLADHPNDPQMKFWMALLLNKKGQTQESLKVYREITQLYPELPEPHNNLGILLAKTGELDEAKTEFEMALREQPDLANTMENLSHVYLLLTQQTLQKALTLNPQSHSLAAQLQAVDTFIKGLDAFGSQTQFNAHQR